MNMELIIGAVVALLLLTLFLKVARFLIIMLIVGIIAIWIMAGGSTPPEMPKEPAESAPASPAREL